MSYKGSQMIKTIITSKVRFKLFFPCFYQLGSDPSSSHLLDSPPTVRRRRAAFSSAVVAATFACLSWISAPSGAQTRLWRTAQDERGWRKTDCICCGGISNVNVM